MGQLVIIIATIVLGIVILAVVGSAIAVITVRLLQPASRLRTLDILRERYGRGEITGAGVLILRRAPLGYLMALSLLVLEAMLAPMIVAQTVSQVRAGVEFTPGEIIGPIAGFLTVAVIAIWIEITILRKISEPSAPSAYPFG